MDNKKKANKAKNVLSKDKFSGLAKALSGHAADVIKAGKAKEVKAKVKVSMKAK